MPFRQLLQNGPVHAQHAPRLPGPEEWLNSGDLLLDLTRSNAPSTAESPRTRVPDGRPDAGVRVATPSSHNRAILHAVPMALKLLRIRPGTILSQGEGRHEGVRSDNWTRYGFVVLRRAGRGP